MFNRTRDRAERFNRALDTRAPDSTGDPDLDALVLLAERLRQELPHDLPDPRFRSALKAQLLQASARGAIRPVPMRAARARFPYVATAAAIAAVLIAAIAVGTLALWGTGGRTLTVTTQESTAVSNTLSMARTATVVAAGASEMTATTTSRVAEVEQGVATSQSTIATVAGTATSDAAPGLAALPPLDATSVEVGPAPAADGGGEPPTNDVIVVLNTTVPDLGASAPVYELTSAEENPAALTARAAGSLGITGDVTQNPSVNGRHVEFAVFADTGAFVYTPDTGAFSFSVTNGSVTPAATLDEQQAITAASGWLMAINFPLDQLAATPRAEPFDDWQWRVVFPAAGMPELAVGKPAGVTLYVNGDGQVTSGDGYWLTLRTQQDAVLLSADEAIRAVQSRGGWWWGGGGIWQAGGEFRVDDIGLVYILTSASESGRLVLQPAVRASGEFVGSDGNTARIAVFVQAAQAQSP